MHKPKILTKNILPTKTKTRFWTTLPPNLDETTQFSVSLKADISSNKQQRQKKWEKRQFKIKCTWNSPQKKFRCKQVQVSAERRFELLTDKISGHKSNVFFTVNLFFMKLHIFYHFWSFLQHKLFITFSSKSFQPKSPKVPLEYYVSLIKLMNLRQMQTPNYSILVKWKVRFTLWNDNNFVKVLKSK